MKNSEILSGNLKLYFFLSIITCLNSSFFIQSEDELVIPKVNKDLSWIKEYTSIYNLFNQDQWEKNPNRSFDSAGVHLTKKNYHPVNACHYALFCYDEYKSNKNERFKKAFLAQVSYLRDSTKYMQYNCDKVGYPYNMAFHDLKVPWYSSLAQGEAISVLIRYYALTKDETILPLIVKIKNFMIYPMQKGGCFYRTPEGYEWFEEYPNSKQEVHNFSGYYIAVMAIGEYSNLFPGDTASFNLYKRCLNGGKINNKIYDSGSGIFYNRGDKRLCSPPYLKWMTNLMFHLYEFTGDKFFKYQHQIWATYSYGKDYIDVGVKKDYYNWAVPVEETHEGFKPEIELVKTSNILDYSIKEIFPAALKDAGKLNDKVPYSFVNFFINDTIHQKPYMIIELKDTSEINKLSIQLTKDSLVQKSIELKYQLPENNDWKNIKIKTMDTLASRNFVYSFEKIKCKNLKITYNIFVENKILPVAEVKVYKSDTVTLQKPECYFYTTSPYQLTKDKAKFNCSFNSVDDYNVFVRKSDTKEKLKSTPYEILEVNNKLPIVMSEPNKFYQFLIIYEIKNSQSVLTKVDFD
jgi:heparosan-N-sulfate-glucuronate 5-epimerase